MSGYCYSWDSIVSDYLNWRDSNVYGCISVYDNQTSQCVYKWFKCAKRGNDVYNWKISNKLSLFLSNLDDSAIDLSNIKRTNTLYITLTDASLLDPRDSWADIGKRFNLFLSNLKKRFGDTAHVRCFEAFKSGYPHIHAVITFRDYMFDVVPHVSNHRKNKGKVTYRLPMHHLEYHYEKLGSVYGNKEYRVLSDRSFIKSFWNGHVDIQAVSDFKESVSYLFKYVLKDVKCVSDSSLLTTALNWYFKKRSFSLSKNLLKYARLETKKSISNLFNDFFNYFGLKDVKLNLEYQFIGVFPLENVKEWNFITKIPPDEFILKHGFQ